MQIDHRITNGLAWAGAALVVAIVGADFVMRQFEPVPAPQIAVIEEQVAEVEPDASNPVLPTPVSERPAPEVAETTPAPQEVAPKPEQVAEAQVADAQAPKADRVTTANAARTSGGDAVDAFIRSGRELPSYISDGGGASAPSTPAPAPTAAPAPSPTPKPAEVAGPTPAVTPPAATVTPPKVVTMPTPVSERPPSVASAPAPAVVPPPPLVIDNPAPVVTAEDLEDWETGPLSEFLANRQGQGRAVPPPDDDYDANGFFLDEGPNKRRLERFPRAYEGEYYPFGR